MACVDRGPRPTLADVVRAAADGARAALEGTPDQLAALRDAGVVDAGGAGLCVVLDALVTTVTGVEPARPPLAPAARPGTGTATARARDVPHQPPARAGQRGAVPARRRRRGRRRPAARPAGRARRQPRRRRRRHPHAAGSGTCTCTSPTSARRSRRASRPGRPYRISVDAAGARPPARAGAGHPARWSPSCASDGLAELFADEGVRVVTCGPDGVTEDDVLDEILASAGAEVVVLPNDADLHPGRRPGRRPGPRARAARSGSCRRASPVQGLAACAVGDPGGGSATTSSPWPRPPPPPGGPR